LAQTGVRRILRFWVVSCLVSGCSSGSGIAEPFELESPLLTSDRSWIRDAAGRVVVLRGVNARVDGIFDVTFDDGRLPLQDIPELGRADLERMRQLGFNVLRLPINWSGVEPERDRFDMAYLDRVEHVVSMCGELGIWVMLDVHQDAYSKEIGEDGAPLWAVHPPPTELLGGPLGDSLEERRVSKQVLDAFAGFFVDDDDDLTDRELQAEFADMLAHVAARFEGDPWVLGYEIFNEPVAPAHYLTRFYERVTARVRQVDAQHLMFFEPNAIRNFLDQAPPAAAPYGDPLGVYAPHLYTYVFGDFSEQLARLEPSDLRPNVDAALAEARSWNTPLFIGEWGISPQAVNADLYVRSMLQHFDTSFIGSTVWLWKEQSQGRWGFYEHDDGAKTWTERPEIVALHSRVYAQAIAGEPLDQRYDPDGHAYELRFEGRDDDVPTRIFVPAPPVHPERFRVLCDGIELRPQPLRNPLHGSLEVPCSGAGMRRIEIVTD
jgi:endoglycosylceramidase